jgi:cell division septal protein FtsQ
LKIFSKHRKKLDAHRRFGGREFKDKLLAAKNHKRNFNPNKEGFFSGFFGKTGFSKVGTAVGVGFIALIFYFLAVSNYFLVTSVQVSGNQQVSSDNIKQLVASLGKHRFLLVPENSFFPAFTGQACF